MSPGDRVRQKASGIQGRVVRLDGPEHVIVDGPDGEVRWNVRSLKLVVQARAPRGVTPVSDRKLAAVRLVDEGLDRAEVMRLYEIERHELQQWIEDVRSARADEKNLETIRRVG